MGKLAVATTNGGISVFDCESHITSQNRSTPKEIWESGSVTTRSVHKLCWGFDDPSLLLSGNQDGIIRKFDTRIKNASSSSSSPACVNSFNPKSDAIKDIQFDPFSHAYFAAISDNGHVSIYDMRQEEAPVHKFLAHTSAGICLSYHPSRNKILATGGKDKYVKFWTLPDISNTGEDAKSPDMPFGTSPFTTVGSLNNRTSNSGSGQSGPNTAIDRMMHATPRSFASLRTPGQVSRIRWRPGTERRFESQLATSSIERNEVYVWNTNLPHLPVCILQGHSDVCTDFQWVDTPSTSYRSPLLPMNKGKPTKETSQSVFHDDEFLHAHQHIVSVSKDGKMLLHDLRNSYFPRQHIFGHGVGLSALGDLAHHAGYVPKVIILFLLIIILVVIVEVSNSSSRSYSFFSRIRYL